MSRTAKLVVGVITVGVVAALLWVVLGSGPSDSDQIKSALQNAIKASREGRAGGVLDYLSDSLTVNNERYHAGSDVAQAIRKYKPDVAVNQINPVIQGDNATVTSDVQLSVLTRSISVPNVTFTFSKEQGHKWLFFPSTQWKLNGVSAPQESVESVAAQFMFGS